MSKCQVCIERDPADGHLTICRQPAVAEVNDWGKTPTIQTCDDHAREAERDGAHVDRYEAA